MDKKYRVVGKKGGLSFNVGDVVSIKKVDEGYTIFSENIENYDFTKSLEIAIDNLNSFYDIEEITEELKITLNIPEEIANGEKMKIWEINLSEKDVTYVDKHGCEWNSDGCTLITEKGTHIENVYNLNAILKMDFKIVVDWSKVGNDDKIWVRQREEKGWKERHFAKCEDGKVYAWDDGCTSWTTKDCMDWNYAKLAEGIDEK